MTEIGIQLHDESTTFILCILELGKFNFTLRRQHLYKCWAMLGKYVHYFVLVGYIMQAFEIVSPITKQRYFIIFFRHKIHNTIVSMIQLDYVFHIIWHHM